MMLKALKYTGYAILIFGFIYIGGHFVYMKGKQHERLHGENVVLMSDCFESDLFIKCTHTYINSETIKQLYTEVKEELKRHQQTGGARNIGIETHPPSDRLNAPPVLKEQASLSSK